jgi:hypothetical protein
LVELDGVRFGIATFSSRGSGFDTLLAIYTGTDVSDSKTWRLTTTAALSY